MFGEAVWRVGPHCSKLGGLQYALEARAKWRAQNILASQT
jgi:hypothetical protein